MAAAGEAEGSEVSSPWARRSRTPRIPGRSSRRCRVRTFLSPQMLNVKNFNKFRCTLRRTPGRWWHTPGTRRTTPDKESMSGRSSRNSRRYCTADKRRMIGRSGNSRSRKHMIGRNSTNSMRRRRPGTRRRPGRGSTSRSRSSRTRRRHIRCPSNREFPP